MDEQHEELLRKISEKVNETHTLLTHPEMGVIPLVKRHDKILCGNGIPGLKTQTMLIWLAVGLLGTDNALVRRLVGWFWK